MPAAAFWPAWDRRKEPAKMPGPRKVLAAHASYARWVAFDAKGERLVSIGTDGKVRVWNPATGAAVRTIEAPDGEKVTGQAAEFVPGTNLLAASYHDGLRFWDAGTGEPAGEPLPPDKFGCLAVSPDGKTAAVAPAAAKQPIARYAVAARDPLPGLAGHTAGVQELAFSADSKFLASAAVAPDCSVRVWDLESGREAYRHDRPSWDPNVSVAFAADGRVMFASARGLVGFLDWRGKRVAEAVRWFPLGAAALGPGGGHLILGGTDGVVTVVDARTGEVLAESNGGSRVWRIAVSPDGKTVATAHHDGKVRVWDWEKLVGKKP
jgi:WD40 repeat protein